MKKLFYRERESVLTEEDYYKDLHFSIPEVCRYIREQKSKGRTSEDITLDELMPFITNWPAKGIFSDEK